MSERIRIMIVDDHAVVRQGLRSFLQLQPDLQVVGEAADGRTAIGVAAGLNPDVVLMDLVMPGAVMASAPSGRCGRRCPRPRSWC